MKHILMEFEQILKLICNSSFVNWISDKLNSLSDFLNLSNLSNLSRLKAKLNNWSNELINLDHFRTKLIYSLIILSVLTLIVYLVYRRKKSGSSKSESRNISKLSCKKSLSSLKDKNVNKNIRNVKYVNKGLNELVNLESRQTDSQNENSSFIKTKFMQNQLKNCLKDDCNSIRQATCSNQLSNHNTDRNTDYNINHDIKQPNQIKKATISNAKKSKTYLSTLNQEMRKISEQKTPEHKKQLDKQVDKRVNIRVDNRVDKIDRTCLINCLDNENRRNRNENLNYELIGKHLQSKANKNVDGTDIGVCDKKKCDRNSKRNENNQINELFKASKLMPLDLNKLKNDHKTIKSAQNTLKSLSVETKSTNISDGQSKRRDETKKIILNPFLNKFNNTNNTENDDKLYLQLDSMNAKERKHQQTKPINSKLIEQSKLNTSLETLILNNLNKKRKLNPNLMQLNEQIKSNDNQFNESNRQLEGWNVVELPNKKMKLVYHSKANYKPFPVELRKRFWNSLTCDDSYKNTSDFDCENDHNLQQSDDSHSSKCLQVDKSKSNKKDRCSNSKNNFETNDTLRNDKEYFVIDSKEPILNNLSVITKLDTSNQAKQDEYNHEDKTNNQSIRDFDSTQLNEKDDNQQVKINNSKQLRKSVIKKRKRKSSINDASKKQEQLNDAKESTNGKSVKMITSTPIKLNYAINKVELFELDQSIDSDFSCNVAKLNVSTIKDNNNHVSIFNPPRLYLKSISIRSSTNQLESQTSNCNKDSTDGLINNNLDRIQPNLSAKTKNSSELLTKTDQQKLESTSVPQLNNYLEPFLFQRDHQKLETTNILDDNSFAIDSLDDSNLLNLENKDEKLIGDSLTKQKEPLNNVQNLKRINNLSNLNSNETKNDLKNNATSEICEQSMDKIKEFNSLAYLSDNEQLDTTNILEGNSFAIREPSLDELHEIHYEKDGQMNDQFIDRIGESTIFDNENNLNNLPDKELEKINESCKQLDELEEFDNFNDCSVLDKKNEKKNTLNENSFTIKESILNNLDQMQYEKEDRSNNQFIDQIDASKNLDVLSDEKTTIKLCNKLDKFEELNSFTDNNLPNEDSEAKHILDNNSFAINKLEESKQDEQQTGLQLNKSIDSKIKFANIFNLKETFDSDKLKFFDLNFNYETVNLTVETCSDHFCRIKMHKEISCLKDESVSKVDNLGNQNYEQISDQVNDRVERIEAAENEGSKADEVIKTEESVSTVTVDNLENVTKLVEDKNEQLSKLNELNERIDPNHYTKENSSSHLHTSMLDLANHNLTNKNISANINLNDSLKSDNMKSDLEFVHIPEYKDLIVSIASEITSKVGSDSSQMSEKFLNKSSHDEIDHLSYKNSSDVNTSSPSVNKSTEYKTDIEADLVKSNLTKTEFSYLTSESYDSSIDSDLDANLKIIKSMVENQQLNDRSFNNSDADKVENLNHQTLDTSCSASTRQSIDSEFSFSADSLDQLDINDCLKPNDNELTESADVNDEFDKIKENINKLNQVLYIESDRSSTNSTLEPFANESTESTNAIDLEDYFTNLDFELDQDDFKFDEFINQDNQTLDIDHQDSNDQQDDDEPTILADEDILTLVASNTNLDNTLTDLNDFEDFGNESDQSAFYNRTLLDNIIEEDELEFEEMVQKEIDTDEESLKSLGLRLQAIDCVLSANELNDKIESNQKSLSKEQNDLKAFESIDQSIDELITNCDDFVTGNFALFL